MQETFRAIITEMGGTPTSKMPTEAEGYGIAPGGRIIHEVGVTRMGNDPSTSALNKYCQAHDAKNVFVADAGPLVSQADKNCTWTILALAMRRLDDIERPSSGQLGAFSLPLPLAGEGGGEGQPSVAVRRPPLWDGQAASRIAACLLRAAHG